MMKILVLEDVNTFYDLSHILFDVSLTVEKGNITGLLGRNGAGKTTTLKTIMGLVSPRSGAVYFGDKDITGLKSHEVAKSGIAYVPDDRQIFAPLSVWENLHIGMSRKKSASSSQWTIEMVYSLFPVLKTKANRKGIQISGGEQKMLAIGRALMCDPDVLLLDEPTEGLAPMIINSLGETILKIGTEGVTIFLADQNVKFAKRIINYGYIIDKGKIEFSAPMDEIWRNTDLVCKYLAV